jgi:thioredoxin-like negative regulator of GroEL
MFALTPSLDRLARLAPVVVLLLAVCVAPPARAQVAEARQALDEGRFAEAISLLTAGLQQTPHNFEMRVLRAQALEARGRLEEAGQDYEYALRLRPNDAVALSGLQRMRRDAGSAATASVEVFRRHLEANPNNLSLRLQYADALRDAGRAVEAAEQYRIYLGRTQGTPDVMTRYLVVLAGLARHAAGAEEAARFLDIYPSSSDLWMRLAYFRLWQGHYRPAEQAFRQALSLDARNQEARRGLAQSQERAAEAERHTPAPAAAATRLEQQLARNPNQPDLRFQLIDELIRLHRYVEAFGQLQMLHSEFGQTRRWQERFRTVDAALPGDAEVYEIDRLTYRLELSPTASAVRYALVDALLEEHRYHEAQTHLLADPAAAADAQAHQRRLERVRQARLSHARQQRALLTARWAANPRDVEAARDLAGIYRLLQESSEPIPNVDDVIALYERLLALRPDDHEVRLHYARFLAHERRIEDALTQHRLLLREHPDDPRYIAAYLYAALQQDPPPIEAERIAQRGAQIAADDPALLLALASFYTWASLDGLHHLDQAERFIQGAAAAGAQPQEIAERREAVQRARRYFPLTEAREAANLGRYEDAIDIIESYYRTTGIVVPRQAKVELAGHYAATGDLDGAIRLLEEAQREAFTEDVQLALARFRFDNRDYPGALAAVEPVLMHQPGNADAHILFGDALREMKRFDEAEVAYRRVLAVGDSRARVDAEERLAFLDEITRQHGAAHRFVATADIVAAGGDGISYRRVSPGLDAQFAMTATPPVTLTAGYQNHYISGSNVILPQLARDVPPYSADQLRAGVIVDITPNIGRGLANHLHAEAGLFVYRGFRNAFTGQPASRTAPHWSLTLTHWRSDLLQLSLRARQTEGAVDLWAPAGPSVDMSLVQADIHASARPLDGLLKFAGRVAFNRVRHDQVEFDVDGFGVFTGERVFIQGYSVDLKLGYRLLDALYGGLIYNRLEYDQSSPFFFTPSTRPYELYEAFLEYETLRTPGEPYFRALAAVGTVAFSGGFLTGRLEGELIYPLATNLSLGLNLRTSRSGRAFPDGTFSGYDIFAFTGALYISL